MSEEITNVQAVKVDYRCPNCKDGYLRPTGECFPTSPPQYPHTCSNEKCDYGETMRNKTYPYIDYIDYQPPQP